MLLLCLKGTQLSVAIATTFVLGAGLLLPGAMALFVVPLALLYVIWAIRAAFDKRLSIWLSFVSTLAVAVLLGALAVPLAVSRYEGGGPNNAIPLVAMDPTGNVVQLPPEALPRLREMQAQIDRRGRIHASILLSIGVAAWLVIGMYAFEWRWAFFARRPSESQRHIARACSRRDIV